MIPELQRPVRIALVRAFAALCRPVTAAVWALLALWGTTGPARGLPVFARQYHVACSMCHSLPPRLNTFGYAFQANHFNWPGPDAPKKAKFGAYLPITAIGTASYAN